MTFERCVCTKICASPLVKVHLDKNVYVVNGLAKYVYYPAPGPVNFSRSRDTHNTERLHNSPRGSERACASEESAPLQIANCIAQSCKLWKIKIEMANYKSLCSGRDRFFDEVILGKSVGKRGGEIGALSRTYVPTRA